MTKAIVSQQGSHYEFDAIVIGSGIAAFSYALEFVKNYPNATLALVTKLTLGESNSCYAQGGIAAAIAPEDTVAAHVHDTLQAGAGFSEPVATEILLQQGADSIAFLEQQGMQFDRENNALARGHEAGHSARRIFHCGDNTGWVVIETLKKVIQQETRIQLFEHHTAINLITHAEPAQVPEVIGVYVLDNQTTRIHVFASHLTVLATGGAGKVFRYTTNPDVATGDGVAMAYRAGAQVKNMEFYQFHPTLLFHLQEHNFLLTEALRGEGAYLRSPATGDRFMQAYAPDKMELATRDVVARAIFHEIEKGEHGYVHLDIRHHKKSFLDKRFPMITARLAQLGLDLSRDLIPVVPGAHYMCGGVTTDTHGCTTLPRLYAIGETACTGLHGANRLASNSLLEGIVMGRLSAKHAEKWLAHVPRFPFCDIKPWVSMAKLDHRRRLQINAHWRGLRGEMNAYAGIIRTEEGLEDLLRLILLRREMIEKHYWEYAITRDLIELRNIVLVGELIIRAALVRRESCGNHYREDFPFLERLS